MWITASKMIVYRCTKSVNQTYIQKTACEQGYTHVCSIAPESPADDVLAIYVISPHPHRLCPHEMTSLHWVYYVLLK